MSIGLAESEPGPAGLVDFVLAKRSTKRDGRDFCQIAFNARRRRRAKDCDGLIPRPLAQRAAG